MRKIAVFLFASVALYIVAIIYTVSSAADMPLTGSGAPAFTLPDQDGKDIALSQFHGKWVVLYFYPKDFTKGCSLEAHNFQEDLPAYAKLNAVIVGVSVDSAGSHKSFCAKEGLNFKLLSDANHLVSDTYGSLAPLPGVTLSARHTFLIDPAGVVRKSYARVEPSNHSAQVLADLSRLETEKK